MIDFIPDPVVITDQTGKTVAKNKTAEEYANYSRQEIAGTSFQGRFLDASSLKENVLNKLSAKDLGSQELKIIAENGDFRFMESENSKIELDDEVFNLFIFHDVTERKKTEQALWKAKNDWELTFNSVPDLIAILDDKHRIVRVNHAMAAALGAVPEKCVGLHCYSCVHGTSCAPAFCPHSKTLKDGREHIEEVHDDRLGGDFLVSTTPIVDEKGRVTGSVHVARNITERKQAEKELEEYAKQLADTQVRLVNSERLAAIGELARQIGHDLRNPLASMKNAAFYLKKKGNNCTAEDKARMLDIIDKDIMRSDKIINDLLEYSGEICLECGECTPRSLLITALSKVQIPECVKVENFAFEEPVIIVDVDNIQRVFISIIKNAFEAMPNGGTLTIRSAESNFTVRITFSDTGIGIPEELLPKIFSPLLTTKAQGMGLSLAICKRIVDSHGGKIEAQSSLNRGATFTVILPLKTQPASTSSASFTEKDPLLHYSQ